jgi:hypothetical protein
MHSKYDNIEYFKAGNINGIILAYDHIREWFLKTKHGDMSLSASILGSLLELGKWASEKTTDEYADQVDDITLEDQLEGNKAELLLEQFQEVMSKHGLKKTTQDNYNEKLNKDLDDIMRIIDKNRKN